MSTTRKAGDASTPKSTTVAILLPLTQEMFDTASAEDGLDLVQSATLPADDDERLTFLQTHVGGYVEFLVMDEAMGHALPYPVEMVVNEEGLINNLPLNVVASRLFQRPIFGTAVVYGLDPDAYDEDGAHNTRSISLGLLRAITAAYSKMIDTLMEAPIEVEQPVETYNKFILSGLLGLLTDSETEGA